MLFTADNLHVLNGMDGESVDLIYLAPPLSLESARGGCGVYGGLPEFG